MAFMVYFAVLLLTSSFASTAGKTNLDCTPWSYDFSGLTAGSPFSQAKDGAWFMKVTPTMHDETDCSAIFDSAHPTKMDIDLGTPGECLDGPGKGAGGRDKRPGKNCIPFGNLLVCHGGDMNSLRSCKCDSLLCDNCQPNDRAEGAIFKMTFRSIGTFHRFIAIDLEGREAMGLLFQNGTKKFVQGLGHNSVQVVNIGFNFTFGDQITIHCKDSCAIARLDMDICKAKPVQRYTTKRPKIFIEPLETPQLKESISSRDVVVIWKGPKNATVTPNPSKLPDIDADTEKDSGPIDYTALPVQIPISAPSPTRMIVVTITKPENYRVPYMPTPSNTPTATYEGFYEVDMAPVKPHTLTTSAELEKK